MTPIHSPAPVRLGALSLDAPIVLAPMAGFTQLPFRLLCRRYGCPLVYTEMISVDGLVRNVAPTWHLLETDPAERPVVAHLYGHRPEIFAEAAARVEALGVFDAIDINAGCPMHKIVRRGAGSGLIRDLPRLEAIVRAVRESVRLPVWVKTRIGFRPGEGNPEDIVRAIAGGGADAVAIHARYTSVRHSGPADLKTLARIKASSPIPVIGNGGIRTPEHALGMLRDTGVDAVMVGRGALGRPWVFEQIRSALQGREVRSVSWEERESVLREHILGLVRLLEKAPKPRRKKDPLSADETAARLFRPQLIHYMAGFRGALEMRRHLNDIGSSADIFAHVARIKAAQSWKMP